MEGTLVLLRSSGSIFLLVKSDFLWDRAWNSRKTATLLELSTSWLARIGSLHRWGKLTRRCGSEERSLGLSLSKEKQDRHYLRKSSMWWKPNVGLLVALTTWKYVFTFYTGLDLTCGKEYSYWNLHLNIRLELSCLSLESLSYWFLGLSLSLVDSPSQIDIWQWSVPCHPLILRKGWEAREGIQYLVPGSIYERFLLTGEVVLFMNVSCLPALVRYPGMAEELHLHALIYANFRSRNALTPLAKPDNWSFQRMISSASAALLSFRLHTFDSYLRSKSANSSSFLAAPEGKSYSRLFPI